jgi:hypothetical protein
MLLIIIIFKKLISFLIFSIKYTLKILSFSLLSKSKLLIISLLLALKSIVFYSIFILFFITKLYTILANKVLINF